MEKQLVTDKLCSDSLHDYLCTVKLMSIVLLFLDSALVKFLKLVKKFNSVLITEVLITYVQISKAQRILFHSHRSGFCQSQGRENLEQELWCVTIACNFLK